jgi:hypothetical protein
MALEKNVEIKWTGRITNDEIFKRAKEGGLPSKILKIGANYG